jgi:putative ABC transport system permease protein
MSLDIRPTLSALLRNRTGAVLVAAQVAIALAVLSNAAYIIVQRFEKIHRATGIDEQNILVIESAGFTDRFHQTTSVQEDIGYLRGLSGVIAATASNSIPLSNGGNNDSLVTRPDAPRHGYINDMEVDEQGLDTLGVRLVAGRNFRHEEVQPPLNRTDASSFVPVIIVRTRSASRSGTLSITRRPLSASSIRSWAPFPGATTRVGSSFCPACRMSSSWCATWCAPAPGSSTR